MWKKSEYNVSHSENTYDTIQLHKFHFQVTVWWVAMSCNDVHHLQSVIKFNFTFPILSFTRFVLQN